MRGPLFSNTQMPAQKDGLASYLAAANALRSGDPTTRRPALSELLELARGCQGVLRSNAERLLTEEFGPYAVSEGLSGCSAPIEVVHACDGNCSSCVWLWQDPPGPSLRQGSVAATELESQPATPIERPAHKSVA